MQGVSSKLSAASVAGLIVTILSYALFTAGWGPNWETPPPEVTAAFVALVSFAIGFFVKETAVNNPQV